MQVNPNSSPRNFDPGVHVAASQITSKANTYFLDSNKACFNLPFIEPSVQSSIVKLLKKTEDCWTVSFKTTRNGETEVTVKISGTDSDEDEVEDEDEYKGEEQVAARPARPQVQQASQLRQSKASLANHDLNDDNAFIPGFGFKSRMSADIYRHLKQLGGQDGVSRAVRKIEAEERERDFQAAASAASSYPPVLKATSKTSIYAPAANIGKPPVDRSRPITYYGTNIPPHVLADLERMRNI